MLSISEIFKYVFLLKIFGGCIMAVKTHMAKSRFQFCSVCDGLLLPKKHKKYLQCIVCGRKQDIRNEAIISSYGRNTSKTPNQELKEKISARKTVVIEDSPKKTVSITEDEREAMEDLFLRE